MRKQISRWLTLVGFLIFFLVATTAWAGAASPMQSASDGEALFKTKCTACHTVGSGKLIGPDLKGVTQRRDISWLSAWIKAPDRVVASGDSTAKQLVSQYGMQMPNMGLNDADVASLIAYFQSVDGGAPAPSASSQASKAQTQPPPALSGTTLVLALNGDPNYGEQLFTGAVALENGGTHCMACHTVNGVGPLGGGALGPDLTHVYARYGRQGLAAALGNIPFPTMQGVFANHPLSPNNQSDLLAFFEFADQHGGQPRTQQNFQTVLGSGSALAVAFLLGMLVFWPRQRMSIAQRLRKNGKL
jgi:mono/diheme cytochrome c family protein